MRLIEKWEAWGTEKARQGIRTGDLLLSELPKVVHLSLIGCATAVPKEQPLQRLAPLQFILEPKHIVLVGEL